MANDTQTPPADVTPALAEQTAQLTALQAKYDAEVAAHAQTKADLTEATKVTTEQHEKITDLTAELEKLQANPQAYSTITVDKVIYEVQTKSFQHNKQEYTVADLIKDKALQKELVKKGVGFLVPKTA